MARSRGLPVTCTGPCEKSRTVSASVTCAAARSAGAAGTPAPSPTRGLRGPAARRRRRARRAAVGAPLRPLELREQGAEAPLAPAERLLERSRALLGVGHERREVAPQGLERLALSRPRRIAHA